MRLWLAFALAAGVSAQDLPRKKIHEIKRAIYQLDYQEAERLCRELMREAPDHPAGYVYLARTYWASELNHTRGLSVERYAGEEFFRQPAVEISESSKRRFAVASGEAISRAERWLAEHPSHPDALYLAGVAHEIKAGWQFAIEKAWVGALRSGGKSFDYHTSLLKQQPGYIDAQITTAGREFILGSLPWYLKVVGFFARLGGDKEKGLRLMEEVAARGDLAADDARALLAVFYARERRFERAAEMLQRLRGKYPANYLLPLDVALLALLQDRPREALGIYSDVLAAGLPKAEQVRVKTRAGLAARLAGDLKISESYLREAVQEAEPGSDTLTEARSALNETLKRIDAR